MNRNKEDTATVGRGGVRNYLKQLTCYAHEQEARIDTQCMNGDHLERTKYHTRVVIPYLCQF